MALKAWLADRLDSLAGWLEDRSRDAYDAAWRLRPRSKGPRYGSFDGIITAALRENSSKLAESITRNNALLRAMKDDGKWR